MGEDEIRAGIFRHQFGAIPHLRREQLKIEGQAVILQAGDILADGGVEHLVRSRREAVFGDLVPMELHPDAAQQRVLLQSVELRPDIIDGHVGVADNGMRPSRWPWRSR